MWCLGIAQSHATYTYTPTCTAPEVFFAFLLKRQKSVLSIDCESRAEANVLWHSLKDAVQSAALKAQCGVWFFGGIWSLFSLCIQVCSQVFIVRSVAEASVVKLYFVFLLLITLFLSFLFVFRIAPSLLWCSSHQLFCRNHLVILGVLSMLGLSSYFIIVCIIYFNVRSSLFFHQLTKV